MHVLIDNFSHVGAGCKKVLISRRLGRLYSLMFTLHASNTPLDTLSLRGWFTTVVGGVVF
jgi:hypothetical protein